MTSPPKPARPKSAVRRQTIDRDLDMIEGLDFTEEVDLDEEDEIDIHLQGEEEEEIDIHLKDDEEIIIDGDNHGEEEAADLEVDIVPYEFHDDADDPPYYRYSPYNMEKNSRGTPRMSMSSHQMYSDDISNDFIADDQPTRAQSANFSKEDEPFINQQGVHELFAEILFADPNDWDDEGDSSSMVDEATLFSSNRSFEDWQEEMRSNGTDSIEEEIDFKSEDFFAKTSSEHLKSEEILIPTTTTKCQSIENNKKQPTSSNMIEKKSTKFEVSKYDLKCEKNNRKNRAILKLLSQKIDGTQEFINQEAQMMHRLLARSGADPESRAKVEQMQFQHGKSLRPRQFNLGYPELQKASGLRVLRRLVERQKSVEESVEDTILANPIIMTTGIRKPLLMIDKCKKKPPARLKPLVPLG